MQLTRSQIQDQLKTITGKTQDPEAVKTAIQMWLQGQKASDFETKQIMNDLTSYPEYLSLIN
jgi:dsRNA-specific ribonuclease